MVYQIYYDNGNFPRQVLFDIEIYMKINETLYNKEKHAYTSDEKWYVEMHSDAFISGAIEFIKSRIPIFTDDDWKEFKKDCDELEELRGWLWETHSNNSRIEELASKDYDEWSGYVRQKIYDFANKYNLEVNVD